MAARARGVREEGREVMANDGAKGVRVEKETINKGVCLSSACMFQRERGAVARGVKSEFVS